jgi:hypothetical protein
MIIRGYPEDVLLPGDFHTTSNKGITNLTLKETGILIAALKAGSMQVKRFPRLRKVCFNLSYYVHAYSGSFFIALLLTSEMPVLEGAPPAEDSAHRGARCLFANGQSDRLGLPVQSQVRLLPE